MNYKWTPILLASTITLAACGNDNSEKNDKTNNTTEKAEQVTTEAPKKNGELKDKTAVLNDIDVKVLETKFLPKGTYEFQEKDQLVVTYEVTNKTDKEIDPINGWFAAFEAYQEDENAFRKLQVGPVPNMDEYQYVLDSQLDIIKKGGIVKNAIAYNLEDTTTPVLLQAHKGVGGEKLGTLTISLKK